MFQEFPYSDMHQLNLDWIIKIAKDFLDQYTHIQELIEQGITDIGDKTDEGLTALDDKATALQALLDEWYNEHSEDIADQLAQALDDLNAWYNEHSEDIAGELADALADLDTAIASKVAAAIASIPSDYSTLATQAVKNFGHVPSSFNLNDIADNCIYQVYTGDNPTNYPFGNDSGIVITNMVYSTTTKTQYAIPFNPDGVWRVLYRKCSNGTWTDWRSSEELLYANTGIYTGDLNDIAVNNVVQVNGSTPATHYPSGIGSGTVITNLFSGSNYRNQIAIGYSNPVVMTRRYNGTWTNWETMYDGNIMFPNKGLQTAGANLNGFTKNGVYNLRSGGSYVNYPFGGNAGILFVNEYYTDIIWQMCLPYNTDTNELSYYATRHYSNNTWSAWQKAKWNVHIPNMDYIAFGDSVTYGYSADEGNIQSPYNYPALVGSLTGMNIVNKAVPGQGLLKDWDTILTMIDNMILNNDFDNAGLITIGWCYNDSSYYSGVSFGNPSDPVPGSSSGITTWLGYYAYILKKIQQAAPNALIVLVTGYGWKGYTLDEAHFSFADTGYTVRQMYNGLQALCNYHRFPCINQAEGSAINEFNETTIIGDNIHPTYEGYKLYGNFIASRIAALYQNINY